MHFVIRLKSFCHPKPVSDQHRRFDPVAVAGSCGKRLNPAEDGFVQARLLAEQEQQKW